MRNIKMRLFKSITSINAIRVRRILFIFIFCLFTLIIAYAMAKSIPPKSRLITITNSDTLYKDGDLIVYFGRDSCISCSEATKYLTSILPKCSNDIYYFNTDDFRQSEEFQRILIDFKIEEVPTIVKISNGSYLDGLLLISEDGKLKKTSIQNYLAIP